MSTHSDKNGKSNVVSIFSGKEPGANDNPIIRISSELDGIEMLYTNDSSPNKIYSLKIICWALRKNGEVEGLVPWLNNVIPCSGINNTLNGYWEGYRNPGSGDVFYEAPEYKALELQVSARYYQPKGYRKQQYLQEIPDIIGTHAALNNKDSNTLTIIEVLSWRLNKDGRVSAMVADHKKVKTTPVLLGDECLYDAQKNKEFRYFFQYRMANKIKAQDPEALAAISFLMD